MSTASYVAALTVTLMFTASIVVAAARLRRVVAPQWRGTTAAAASTVIGVALVTVLAEILGTADVLTRWWLVATAALVAAGAEVLYRRVDPPIAPPTPTSPRVSAEDRTLLSLAHRWIRPGWELLTVVCVLAIAGQAAFSIWRVAHVGIMNYDALQYHLTDAAAFATTHSTRHIVFDSADAITPYYPFNDELLHGVAMSLWGRDTLSLLLGLGDIAAALIVTWALFRRFGRAVAAAAIAAQTYLLLVLGPDVPASAANDWHATWLLLAGALFVINSLAGEETHRRAALAIGGLAAGMSAASKLNMLTAVVVLALVALAGSPGRRLAALAWYVGMAVVGGGYWFVRDLVYVHNPLPELNLHLGSVALPRPSLPILDSIGFTVVHYLTNAAVLRHYYVPGLHKFFGPLWPLTLLLTAVGLIGGLLKGDSTLRLLTIVGIVSMVTYLVTPTGAAGFAGQPILFYYNIRYGLPGFSIGLIAVFLLSDRAWWRALATALYVLLSLSLLATHTGWSDGLRVQGVAVTVVVAVILLAAAGGGYALRRRPAALVAVAAPVVLVAAIGGFAFQRFYLAHRYHGGPFPVNALLAHNVLIRNSRVGIVGDPLEYPFRGPEWQNTVVYVGRRTPRYGFADFTTCRSFRAALRAGGYGWIVDQPFAGEPHPQTRWLATDPAARLVFRNADGVLYRLTGRSPATGC